MSQPMDRCCTIEAKGEVNEAAGEFWTENPFQMLNSGENLSAYERNRMFLNSGEDQFFEISHGSNTDIDSDSRGVIGADFDRDGDEDLLVINAGGGPLKLFINEIPQQNRIKIRLKSESSGNRTGIGAKIVATIGNGRVHRDCFASDGFAGQSPPEVLIGMGDAAKVDVLSITWPNGKVSEIRDIDGNAQLLISDSGEVTRTEFRKLTP